MAHRKPLGTRTGFMVFDWEGDNPELSDFLVSGAGTWYLVVGEQETRNPAKVKLMLERIADPFRARAEPVIGDVAYAAEIVRVHEFEWHPRDRKRAAA